MARQFDLPKNVGIKRKTLWVRVKDADGNWPWVSTQLSALRPDGKLDDQHVRQAQSFMRACEEEVWRQQKAVETGEPHGPETVRRRFTMEWLPKRFRDGLTSSNDDKARFENYFLPVIGELLMEDVRPQHIDEVMERVKTFVLPGKQRRRRDPLGSSSVKTCFWLLHGFFEAWCGRRYLPNPCAGYDDLPKRRPKDPLWRFSARYSAEEIERLISDERIPLDRRVTYAVLFFTGVRWGEFAALRWSRWRPAKPLAELQVALSYSVKLVDAQGNQHKGEKLTKTEVPRLLPVHPELAKILAEWKLVWANFFGRPPRENDLIVPARAAGQRMLDAPDYRALLDAEPGLSKAQLAARLGVSRAAVTQGCRRAPVKQLDLEKAYRSASVGWKRLQEDLVLLGLRRRRTHDVRRTTNSVLVEAGANERLTRLMLWGPTEEVRDIYTTIAWSAFCAEMIKLPVRRREFSKVLELPAAMEGFGNAFGNAFVSGRNRSGIEAPTTGLEPDSGVTRCSSVATKSASGADFGAVEVTPISSERPRSLVSAPKLGNAHADPVSTLEAKFAGGSAAERKALRKRLARLLADLDD